MIKRIYNRRREEMKHLILNFVHLKDKTIQKHTLELMGKNRFPQLKENYSFYNKLLEGRKSIFSEVIEINKAGNNQNFLERQEVVKHPDLKEERMILNVDVKLNDHSYFQFKLRYKAFLPAPFFRFDSDGDTHRNRIKGIPLEEQQITTPHFHKFNEKGIEIAYKTDKLLDPKEAKALEDINLCLVHFFHESNTRLKEDDFPEVKIMTDTLGYEMEAIDPNENITFL